MEGLGFGDFSPAQLFLRIRRVPVAVLAAACRQRTMYMVLPVRIVALCLAACNTLAFRIYVLFHHRPTKGCRGSTTWLDLLLRTLTACLLAHAQARIVCYGHVPRLPCCGRCRHQCIHPRSTGGGDAAVPLLYSNVWRCASAHSLIPLMDPHAAVLMHNCMHNVLCINVSAVNE